MGCSQILVLWLKSEIPTLAHQLIPLDPSTLKIASLGAEDVSKIILDMTLDMISYPHFGDIFCIRIASFPIQNGYS